MASYVITLWKIWGERNKVTFEGGYPSPYNSLISSQALISEFSEIQLQSVCSSSSCNPIVSAFPPVIVWRSPHAEVSKINSDAAFKKSDGKGFRSIIIRDNLGRMPAGHATKIFASSSLAAEALVLREAVLLASNLDLLKVIFESDCQDLIHACRGIYPIGEIVGIVADICSLRSSFESCGFLWTARKGNPAAHSIADLHSESLLAHAWSVHPPETILRILACDAPRWPVC